MEMSLDKAKVLKVLRGEALDEASGTAVGTVADRVRLACMFALSDKADGSEEEAKALGDAILEGATRSPCVSDPDGVRVSSSTASSIGATITSLFDSAAASASASADSASSDAPPALVQAAKREAERLIPAIAWVRKHRKETSVVDTSHRDALPAAMDSGSAAALGRALLSSIAGTTKTIVSRGADALERLVVGETIHPVSRATSSLLLLFTRLVDRSSHASSRLLAETRPRDAFPPRSHLSFTRIHWPPVPDLPPVRSLASWCASREG
jgi:hypothetical protein